MSITAEEAGRLSQTQSTTASALRLGNRLGMSNLWFAFVALLLGLPMGYTKWQSVRAIFLGLNHRMCILPQHPPMAC